MHGNDRCGNCVKIFLCNRLSIAPFAAFYGDFDRAAQEPESLAVIAKSLELGFNFFDTAWVYQSFGLGEESRFNCAHPAKIVSLQVVEETTQTRSYWAKRLRFMAAKNLLSRPSLELPSTQKPNNADLVARKR